MVVVALRWQQPLLLAFAAVAVIVVASNAVVATAAAGLHPTVVDEAVDLASPVPCKKLAVVAAAELMTFVVVVVVDFAVLDFVVVEILEQPLELVVAEFAQLVVVGVLVEHYDVDVALILLDVG